MNSGAMHGDDEGHSDKDNGTDGSGKIILPEGIPLKEEDEGGLR